ncbi:hypothetical protein HK098_005469 [Nowakowskiella sp. JEL0407]|nr:hypothetical protein HK098_005469 [Nowakowskiella sp. JEL0407]
MKQFLSKSVGGLFNYFRAPRTNTSATGVTNSAVSDTPSATSICPSCDRKFNPDSVPHYQLPVRLVQVSKRHVYVVKDLCHVCVESARKYSIFSHVWGQTYNRYSSEELRVYGITWTVPLRHKKKMDFLFDVAAQKKSEFFWLDVLCMNQDATGSQPELTSMHQYYTNASVCLAILEGLQVGALKSLADTKSIEAVENADRVLRKEFFHVDIAVLSRDVTRQILLYIGAVVNCEWFSRVWTFQELGLPTHIEFFADNGENIDGSTLVRYGRLVNSRRLKYKYTEIDIERIVKKINELRDMRDAATGYASLQAADVLRLVKDRNCRFQQDKVFGTMSLLPYANSVRIDGVKTLNEAVQRLANAAFVAGDYSLLAFSGASQQKSGHRWVPSLEDDATFKELGLSAVSALSASVVDNSLILRGIRTKVISAIPLSSIKDLVAKASEALSISEDEARILLFGSLSLSPKNPRDQSDIFKLHSEITEKALASQLGDDLFLIISKIEDTRVVSVGSGNLTDLDKKNGECTILHTQDFAGKSLAVLSYSEEKASNLRVGYAWVMNSEKSLWDMHQSEFIMD